MLTKKIHSIKINQLFCRHDYEICKKVQKFHCLGGEQLYKRCKKCGKVIKYKFVSNEEFYSQYMPEEVKDA